MMGVAGGYLKWRVGAWFSPGKFLGRSFEEAQTGYSLFPDRSGFNGRGGHLKK